MWDGTALPRSGGGCSWRPGRMLSPPASCTALGPTRQRKFRYLRCVKQLLWYNKDKEVQAHLEGVPAELLYGDKHLDVVAAEAGVDPAGHGELEAAEAAHEEVNTVPAHTPVTWPPWGWSPDSAPPPAAARTTPRSGHSGTSLDSRYI